MLLKYTFKNYPPYNFQFITLMKQKNRKVWSFSKDNLQKRKQCEEAEKLNSYFWKCSAAIFSKNKNTKTHAE